MNDPWRLAEWEALPDVCLIDGCGAGPDDICQRGPVWLRGGAMFKACTEHWEAIMQVTGLQATWERDDAARGAPDA